MGESVSPGGSGPADDEEAGHGALTTRPGAARSGDAGPNADAEEPARERDGATAPQPPCRSCRRRIGHGTTGSAIAAVRCRTCGVACCAECKARLGSAPTSAVPNGHPPGAASKGAATTTPTTTPTTPPPPRECEACGRWGAPADGAVPRCCCHSPLGDGQQGAGGAGLFAAGCAHGRHPLYRQQQQHLYLQQQQQQHHLHRQQQHTRCACVRAGAGRPPCCCCCCCCRLRCCVCARHVPGAGLCLQQPGRCHHLVELRSKKPFEFPKSYSELIADWPIVVLAMCTLLIVVCALVGVLVPELPDFSDPLLGFEPRGTEISQRLVTWNNMLKNTGYMATLANYPFKYAEQVSRSQGQLDKPWNDDYGRDRRAAEWDFHTDAFFCDPPGDGYSRVVFAAADGGSLWNITTIRSMCSLYDARVSSHRTFPELCQRTTTAVCCPSWSLGNYVALLGNRSSCREVTERDLAHALRLLQACAPLYRNGSLGPDCWDAGAGRRDRAKCQAVPRRCARHNAVYQILHYLVDKDFLATGGGEGAARLRYSMLFVPTEKGDGMMRLYRDNLERWNRTDGVTSVVGIEFGIKHSLFQDYLLTDTVYPAVAMVIVLLLMCVYTGSVFVTLMTMFAIVSSLIVAYFVYRVVLRFEFFPFMNLTALVVLVGVGADDAFVLCDVWRHAKADRRAAKGPGAGDAGLTETVRATLRHAALSMFVTSFTTAAAFYANYVSSITAVRCFGVYAGTAVLANYGLMVSWLPAVVVLHERYLADAFRPRGGCPGGAGEGPSLPRRLWAPVERSRRAASAASRAFFERLLPRIVVRLRHAWLCGFVALAAGGAYAVFAWPGMRLPSLELAEFRVFAPSHPFERYDAEHRALFAFERAGRPGSGGGDDLALPVTLIWGVVPEDNGDPLNPADRGKLVLDPGFDVASAESQLWLLDFCRRLRNHSLYLHREREADFSGCFIETFKQWMESEDCDDAVDDQHRHRQQQRRRDGGGGGAAASRGGGDAGGRGGPLGLSLGGVGLAPCCSSSAFPYERDVFEFCIKRAVLELERRFRVTLDGRTPGPRFDANDSLRAVLVEFPSSYRFTLAHERMARFRHEVDAWLHAELLTAPPGLRRGWFVSSLEFYDLQASLWAGSLLSLGLAVGLAFGVMLLTTRSLAVSVYALLAIAGSIAVTTGSLALLGWELNVLESVTVSVAVGLAVDFAVHYGVAYRLAPGPGRRARVSFSLGRMGPAVAMAALTTFLAGAMMMPSTVLAYTQLGTFLMLVMAVSWAYATFFFQSLCCCLGPRGENPTAPDLCCGVARPCVGTPGQKKTTTEEEEEEESKTTLGKRVHYGNGGPRTGAEEYQLQALTSEHGADENVCDASAPERLNRDLDAASVTDEDGVEEDGIGEDPAAASSVASSSSPTIPEEENGAAATGPHDAEASPLRVGPKRRLPRSGRLNGGVDFIARAERTVPVESLLEALEGMGSVAERGSLNGMRPALRLALRGSAGTRDGAGACQATRSLDPIVLPNSEPGVPDVWLKRADASPDSCSV
ncbi:protein dispatched homolog 1-like [Petromyzon marinus]|uniref:protein dispatched homolog 1-like n=1 Tax=Petromyzon marinus TaxID=7757 RepID=UPI003F704396